jgi:methylmalonyl-CoA/ethylmalonyl-CoA epimerase
MGKRLKFLDRKIEQIGYVVQDIDQAVKEYYECFGIGGWQMYTYGQPLVSYARRNGKPLEYQAKIALSYFGETRIELIQQIKGDTVYQEFIERHGFGVHHLGIYVSDIAPMLKEAEEAGIATTMEGSGFGLDGDGYFAYMDTEKRFGTTFELIQRPKRRHPPERVYP